MSNVDKDLARKFYFSNSSSFGSFKTTKAKPVIAAAAPGAASAVDNSSNRSNVSASHVDITLPSSIADVTSAPQSSAKRPSTSGQADSGAAEKVAHAGAGLNAVRTINTSQSKTRPAPTSSSNVTAPPVDAASAEYFAFLRQQQELQRHHASIDETIKTWKENRTQRQTEVEKLRGQASELLQDVENSTNWNLRSKYDVQQLIRDCNLALQPTELVDDKPAQFMAVTQLSNHLTRIRNTYKESAQFAPFGVVTEQAVRRLGLLEQALGEGNMDATNMARIADNLIVQLENHCNLKTLEELVEKHEAAVDRISFDIEQARRKRDEAVNDGEVQIAEALCYSIIELHEQALSEVLTKAKTLEKSIDETTVVTTVCEQYHGKVPVEVDKIRTRCAKLRTRCEDDIKKICALREKVEEVESVTSAKVSKDREASDAFLRDNTKKMEIVFAKMEELEREAEELERQRHREVQKRLAEKDKDEHRRAEFVRFCNVVDTHMIPLERTIKNMLIMDHASTALQELLDSYFDTVKGDLRQREKLLGDVKLEAHKEHTELFRHMLLELGEVTYRKERMIEETDKKVQQAHVQQELLAETFNPNAKRFGDIKKSLLKARDELDGDVVELKQRAAHALDDFQYSQQALQLANVPFVHPVTEQEHHTIALRAKMIEYKAMVVGHGPEDPIMHDIASLRQDVTQTCHEIDAVNVSTTGSVAKALPLIHAANKARLK